MEENASTTRFALACNDSTKIIEPIQSRTVILRFTKLTKEEIHERLQNVIKTENITIDEDALDIITTFAEGDMRNALNNLQSAWIAFAPQIHKADIYQVINQFLF